VGNESLVRRGVEEVGVPGGLAEWLFDMNRPDGSLYMLDLKLEFGTGMLVGAAALKLAEG
jgi:hypothetical protein